MRNRNLLVWALLGLTAIMLVAGTCGTLRAKDEPAKKAPKDAAKQNYLWVGNSFTFNGGIAGLTKNMVNDGQAAVVIDKSDLSVNWNRGLIFHWNNGNNVNGGNTLAMIRSRVYTHVVLQDYMLDPSIGRGYLGEDLAGSYGREISREYCAKFIAEVKRLGGVPIIYCIWPQEKKQSVWDELIQTYKKTAEDNGAVFAPASAAWKLALAERPGLKFWAEDGHHPSDLGVYTCACVFYAVITGQSPVGRNAPNNIDAATAAFVQQKAWEAYKKYGSPSVERK